jgi:AcrR family transcriptional regulator
MSPSTAPTRKDAVRSRRAILDAAHELLGRDQDASFAAIAHAAGVGQATVYRHFPDRQDLIAALLEEATSRLEAGAAKRGPDPDAFSTLLEQVVAEQVSCQGMVSAIREGEMAPARVDDLTSRVLELFREPLAEAREAGRIRPDLDLEQIVILLAMIDGALAQASDSREREEMAARVLDVVLNGVRAR